MRFKFFFAEQIPEENAGDILIKELGRDLLLLEQKDTEEVGDALTVFSNSSSDSQKMQVSMSGVYEDFGVVLGELFRILGALVVQKSSLLRVGLRH